MKTVFLVEHLHTQDDGEEDWTRIGIFSTRTDALAAVERARKLPGFLEYPNMIDNSATPPRHGFNINESYLGMDHWEAGFVTNKHV